MNMVLEKNIPALQQSIRDLDNQCQGVLKLSVTVHPLTETVSDGFCSILRSILRYGGADRPENNVQHQHLLLLIPQFLLSLLKQKKNPEITHERNYNKCFFD